ncbi:hypothetical protein ACH5RR_020677 [Cinchona calisaya]|uniref:Uncharacterized protein n=1 Tax=Cinchona calisaya TaxID=153742 RepID=A0ABD2ZK56_9GENT
MASTRGNGAGSAGNNHSALSRHSIALSTMASTRGNGAGSAGNNKGKALLENKHVYVVEHADQLLENKRVYVEHAEVAAMANVTFRERIKKDFANDKKKVGCMKKDPDNDKKKEDAGKQSTAAGWMAAGAAVLAALAITVGTIYVAKHASSAMEEMKDTSKSIKESARLWTTNGFPPLVRIGNVSLYDHIWGGKK